MSVMDDVRLGDLVFRPSEFKGTNVLVTVFVVAPGEDGQTVMSNSNPKEPEAEGPGGFVVPIRIWETLVVVPAQVAAYLEQFGGAIDGGSGSTASTAG